jgi:hypothetical protein
LRFGHQELSSSRWRPIWILPVRSTRGAKTSLPKSRGWSMRPATVTVSPTMVPGFSAVPAAASSSAIGRAATPRAG